MDAFIAQLAIAQTGHGVIFVEALLRLGRRLHIPFDQRGIDGLGDFMGQNGLASARLTLDQKGAAKQHCGVYSNLEIVRRNIVAGTFEAHGNSLSF